MTRSQGFTTSLAVGLSLCGLVAMDISVAYGSAADSTAFDGVVRQAHNLSQDHRQPSPQRKKSRVSTTKYGAVITSQESQEVARMVARRGREDVEHGSRRVGKVAQRPLTVQERAVVQGRARAQCMQTFLTLSRVFRETGRG